MPNNPQNHSQPPPPLSVNEDQEIFLEAVQAADFLPAEVHKSAATVEGIERRVLDTTYCDFLREQITLAPRGPEWTTVLSRRLAAITPFVGLPTLLGTIRTSGAIHFVRVDPTTRCIIHCEAHETYARGQPRHCTRKRAAAKSDLHGSHLSLSAAGEVDPLGLPVCRASKHS